MEFVIRRKDYDYVQAKAEGYVPVYGKFSDFFGELEGYIDRYGYVNNLEYRNHTLFIEKYDFFGGFLYTDSYVLDGLLESDARFMEGLNRLLALYESKKDELKSNVKRVRNNKISDDNASSHARRILEEYCNTGSFTLPDDTFILDKVYEMYKNNSPEIFSYKTCTMEGDFYNVPTVKLSIPKINTLKALTGVAGVTSACCAAATLSISSPITFAGCLVSGVGAYAAYRKKNRINEEVLREKAREITNILEEKYFSGGEDVKVYSKREN